MFLSKSKFPFWSRLALHALWQHGVWEAAQCRLFTNMSGVPFASALFLMILRFTKSCFKPRPTLASALFLMIAATGADVVLTLALVAIALRFARALQSRPSNARRGRHNRRDCYRGFGFGTRLVAHLPAMPTIRFAGRSIGLWPVVQMTLLPFLAFALARCFSSKSN